MAVGRTLSRHIAWRFTKAIVIAFVVCVLLVIVIDFTELARFSVGSVGFDLGTAAIVALLRGPSLGQIVLPFAVLFGSMATLVALNRRLELTVAKAAGVSAWQVLRPASFVAVAIGVLAVTVYNPLAGMLRDQSVAIGGTAGGVFSGNNIWLRQSGEDGPSIIGADRTAGRGTRLAGVRAFVFDDEGRLTTRIDAPSARLSDDHWVFSDATVTPVDGPPRTDVTYRLHTSLTLEQIGESLADPETVPVWRLPELIEVANAAAVPDDGLRLRLHALLSTPVLLLAMVLIAGVVSLRFSRTLGVGRLAVAGAVSGFVLYVVLQVSQDLGRGGVVSPVVAAWAPALLAMLVSVTVLLNEEDG